MPAEQLRLTAGVMQAFDAVFAEFGMQWLTPILGIMLVAASLGGMLTWLAGPSKGLLLISRQEGYLPPFLQQLNKHGVQQNILVAQGVVTTVIALGYAFIPDVSSAYWIFSVITTQVYLIMYLLMFVAAVRLRRSQPDHPRGFRAPMLVGLCVRRLRRLARRAAGRVHPAVAVRRRQPACTWSIVGRRRARPRPAGAVPVLQVPQAVLEAARGRRCESEVEVSEMSTVERTTQPSRRERGVIYIVVAVVLVILAVIALSLFRTRPRRTEAAEREGRPARSRRSSRRAGGALRDQIVRSLGDDGGAVCANPGRRSDAGDSSDGLLTNGAGGPGKRPVIAENKVLQGQLADHRGVLPGGAAKFQEFVDRPRRRRTARERST